MRSPLKQPGEIFDPDPRSASFARLDSTGQHPISLEYRHEKLAAARVSDGARCSKIHLRKLAPPDSLDTQATLICGFRPNNRDTANMNPYYLARLALARQPRPYTDEVIPNVFCEIVKWASRLSGVKSELPMRSRFLCEKGRVGPLNAAQDDLNATEDGPLGEEIQRKCNTRFNTRCDTI